MNAVQIKELFGDSVAAAISEDLQLAPRPDDAELRRLERVFPKSGSECDMPLRDARTIAQFAPADAPVHAMLEKARGVRHA